MESRSKTALSIHAVSKIMRAMKPNLLQNGRGKQVLGALNLLEDDGKIGSLRVAPHRRLRTAEPFSARIHFQGDPKAASDSKAAENFSELLFAVDMFLGAENAAQEKKLRDSLITGGGVPSSSGLSTPLPREGSWQAVRHEAFIPGSKLAHDKFAVIRDQYPLWPLSDLDRLRPSSRLALPRWRSN